MNGEDFASLYDVQYPRVFLYLLLRLWNRAAAEEITAKVFATALTALRNGNEPRQIRSWLIGMADRLAQKSGSAKAIEGWRR